MDFQGNLNTYYKTEIRIFENSGSIWSIFLFDHCCLPLWIFHCMFVFNLFACLHNHYSMYLSIWPRHWKFGWFGHTFFDSTQYTLLLLLLQYVSIHLATALKIWVFRSHPFLIRLYTNNNFHNVYFSSINKLAGTELEFGKRQIINQYYCN